MFNKILSSPILVRVVPFGIFAALTVSQGWLGESSQYVTEFRWALSWEAAVIGVAVFAAWVGLDGHYPMLAERAEGFNPMRTYGPGSALAAVFVTVRIIGSSLVVPPLEEIFYRSFVYRYLISSDFMGIPLKRLQWRAFLIAGAIFGIGHYEWLPGILCGFAYQGLVCRKNRLGDAIAAHAITNFLLGLWVITRHAYRFW